MSDIVVSRIQHRRGNIVDLPQPLRPGELGWCLDVGKLYIGSDESSVAMGVHIVEAQIATTTGLLTSQVLVVDIQDNAFDLTAFTNALADPATFPSVSGPVDVTISSDLVFEVRDDVVADVMFIGLTDEQASENANYQTDILAALVALNGAFVAGDIVTANTIYTIDSEGTFSTASHAIANALSELLNKIADPVPVANTNLNVEVITEVSITDYFEDMLLTPLSYTLSESDIYPAIGTYVPMSPSLDYNVALSDTLYLDYSVYGYDDPDYVHMTGTLKISAIDGPDVVTFVDDYTRTDGPSTVQGTILFRPTISGGVVTLQYSHNFGVDVVFKTATKRWLSF